MSETTFEAVIPTPPRLLDRVREAIREMTLTQLQCKPDELDRERIDHFIEKWERNCLNGDPLRKDQPGTGQTTKNA